MSTPRRKTFEIEVLENGLFQLSIAGNTSYTAFLLTAELMGELDEAITLAFEKQQDSLTSTIPQNGQEHL